MSLFSNPSKLRSFIVILLLALLAVVLRKSFFLWNSESAVATIQEIQIVNSRCGGRAKYDCTRFRAQVEFSTKNMGRQIASVDLETTAMGHQQRPELSGKRPGDLLKVYYDPYHPSDVEVMGDDFVKYLLALIGAVFVGLWYRFRVKRTA